VYTFASIFSKSFLLTGQIPEWLENLKGLSILNLSNNKFEGTSRIHHAKLLQISIIRFFLIGPIPETLGNCITLTELDLFNNKLEGACRVCSTILPQISQIHFVDRSNS
jgi:hypothetical protein